MPEPGKGLGTGKVGRVGAGGVTLPTQLMISQIAGRCKYRGGKWPLTPTPATAPNPGLTVPAARMAAAWEGTGLGYRAGLGARLF